MVPSPASRDPDWSRLALVRVDDRLLHGQVVLNWARALRPARIIVADDAVAGDDLATAALGAAAPLGVDVWIGSVDDAARALLAAEVDPQRALVLVRDAEAARRLFDAGVRYLRLNVGAVGQAPGRVRIGRQVSLRRDEWEALRYLQRAGVDVTLQARPSDGAVSLARARHPLDWDRPVECGRRSG